MAQSFDAITPVKSLANLLVSINEALKLRVELNILASQHIAMVLESIDFLAHIGVLRLHRLCSEAQVVLLAPRDSHVVISPTILGFEVVECGSQVTVPS